MSASGADPWRLLVLSAQPKAKPIPESGGRIRAAAAVVHPVMVDLWVHDIESLEAVTQDEHTKRICLRMAAMSRAGTLAPFIANLHHDDNLDDSTKGTITEIASDANFLLAVEDYVRRTQLVH
jgi:hypothetical protein